MISNTATNLNVQLISSTGNVLGSSKHDSTQVIGNTLLNAGEYYIKVSRNDGAVAAYGLKLST
jgi:hypothetical protein